MNKFASGEDGRCVRYAISIARAALGMSPQLPAGPEHAGLHADEIVPHLGDWFPNHRVHVFSFYDMNEYIRSDDVIYEGNEMVHEKFPSEDYLFMFMYNTCTNYAHCVIGTVINHDGELVFAVAVERESLRIQDVC